MFTVTHPYGPTHQPLAGVHPLVRFSCCLPAALALAFALSGAYEAKSKPKPDTRLWRGELTGVDYVHLVKELGSGGVDEIWWRLPRHRGERFYPSLKRLPVATWEVRFYYSGRVEVVGDRSAMRVQFWDQLDSLCARMTLDDGFSTLYIQGPTEPYRGPPAADGFLRISGTVLWSLSIRPGPADRLTVYGEPPAEMLAFWTEMVELMPACYASGPETAPFRLRR